MNTYQQHGIDQTIIHPSSTQRFHYNRNTDSTSLIVPEYFTTFKREFGLNVHTFFYYAI